MKKKMSVPMPLMRIAMFGLKPIRIGASTVAPNIAITCCTPIAAVCGQARRSSGATTLPGAMATSRQLKKLLIGVVSVVVVRGVRAASARREDRHRDARHAGHLARVVHHVDLPDLRRPAAMDRPRRAGDPA